MHQTVDMSEAIGRRAADLFRYEGLFCSEAILKAVTESLDGPIGPDLAVRLGVGASNGLGGGGCICGAVSGAVTALSLYITPDNPSRLDRRRVRKLARELHDAFRDEHKGTCCRVLSKPFKEGSREHKEHCAELTGYAGRLVARMILNHRPELDRGAKSPTPVRRSWWKRLVG